MVGGDVERFKDAASSRSSTATGWRELEDAGVPPDTVNEHQDARCRIVSQRDLRSEAIIVQRFISAERFADALAVISNFESVRGAHADAELLRGEVLLAQGKFVEATACVMALLSDNPEHVGALGSVAQLQRRAGNLQGSLIALKKAHSIEPSSASLTDAYASCLVEAGTAAKEAGDASSAQKHYDQALEVVPDHAGALYHLGVLAGEQGRAADSIDLYERAVRSNGSHVEAWTNLGVLRRRHGRLQEALEAFQAAIAFAPNSLVIRSNLAMLYVELGSRAAARGEGANAEARVYYERALAYEPRNADALYNLGVLEGGSKRWERCIFYYESCVAANPRHAMAWNNLGVVYQNVENLERTIACYEAAIEACPDFFQSLNNLGVIYTAQGHYARALRLLRAAIAAKSDYAEAHNNLGVLLRDVGLIEPAIASYETCMALCATSPNAFQNRLLALNYRHHGEERVICDAHAQWGVQYAAQVQPLPAPRPSTWRAPADGKLRIGYISPDLYTHSVSYYAESALQGHDRSRVELFVYCSTPRPDAKSAYLEAECRAKGCTWRRVFGMPGAAVAELIRRDRVDVLVELTGHTAQNRLDVVRFRPAPVQMTWIGYPNSTGLAAVDYRITDSVSDPLDTKQTYVEQLLRLPGCFLCYSPMRNPPPVSEPPLLGNGYVTFGSFNALAKITDEVIETWCDLLQALPTARLVLKNKPFLCPEARALWLQRFTSRGIAAWRVDLLSLTAATDSHLSQYSMMDISLDPWPYAGTTTTCESLFMGVPCITLKGRCHAHNVGLSLLTAIGLEGDWAAASRQEYIDIAKHWAAQPQALAELRRRLRADMLASPLCDVTTFMSQLEDKYEECYAHWYRTGSGTQSDDERGGSANAADEA